MDFVTSLRIDLKKLQVRVRDFCIAIHSFISSLYIL